MEPEPEQPNVYNREYAVSLAKKYGELHGVSSALLMRVMDCEVGGNYHNPEVQSKHMWKGERERSFGYVQIHQDSHPHITYEQATDPEFAVNFLAENISKGKGNMWTCFRKLNGL